MSSEHSSTGVEDVDEFRQQLDQLLRSSRPKRSSSKQDKTDENDEFDAERIWKKFSIRHRISPFNVNNNLSRTIKERKYKRKNESDDNLPKTAEFITFQTSNNLLAQVFQWILRLTVLFLKVLGFALITLTLFYCVFTLHKPTQALISRNTQKWIYPVMRALRLISIPIVKRFPILSDYYTETCLIRNPFFEIAELDCWPCESVRHVIDLTGFSNFSSAYHHSGIPFIVKDAFKDEIGLKEIKEIVSDEKDTFGTVFVDTSSGGLTTLDDVWEQEQINRNDFHMKWYINRAAAARVWRKYFPKPYFIPASTEISVKHYMFVDRYLSPTYRLPLTEFANVFLTQASGSRSIVLIPSKTCQSHCKVVSAVLQQNDVLFYNWLFWRPISLATDSVTQSTSVTFIGSFY